MSQPGSALTAHHRSAIELVEWPTWTWWGKRFFTSIGTWSDMRMVFSGEHADVWTYAYLPERMSFEAGALLTWLEILAFEQKSQFGDELAFAIRAQSDFDNFARGLKLSPCDACSDRCVVSYEGQDLWLRKVAPPSGRPYVVLRSSSVDRATAVVAAARARWEAPPVVAVSNWSRHRDLLMQSLRDQKFDVMESRRLWRSELWRTR